MTAETIAKALGGRKAGGGWTARCPAHDDKTPSLSIRDADGGKVLIRCHTGCDREQDLPCRHESHWPSRIGRAFNIRAARARSPKRRPRRDRSCRW